MFDKASAALAKAKEIDGDSIEVRYDEVNLLDAQGKTADAITKLRAILDNRYHVARDDIRAVASPALRHRLILNFEGQAESIQPDQVIVWNETQKREAVRLHGVAPDRVRVTGAQLFDDWFDRTPGDSREAQQGDGDLRRRHGVLVAR